MKPGHLQGRRAHQACHLHFGLDLVRHEVEKADLQRTDVLPHGGGLGHHTHPFLDEGAEGGQGIGNLDRHGTTQQSRGRRQKNRIRSVGRLLLAAL